MLSNDEGRKRSSHFLALPFVCTKVPVLLLAPAAKVRAGIGICVLQAFPFGNIYDTVKSSVPRDDLSFSPQTSRDSVVFACLSTIPRPRQRRTSEPPACEETRRSYQGMTEPRGQPRLSVYFIPTQTGVDKRLSLLFKD